LFWNTSAPIAKKTHKTFTTTLPSSASMGHVCTKWQPIYKVIWPSLESLSGIVKLEIHLLPPFLATKPTKASDIIQ
jgi:hypothetical protein